MESLLDINQQSTELQLLKNVQEDIYSLFSLYSKPNNLTCLDYGMTQEESLIFNSNELKYLPYDFMQKLEFYDYSWKSWGGENEVKYLLPRILECFAILLLNQEDSHVNTSITYKLLNLENWTSEELIIIKYFAINLFDYYICYGNLKLINSAFDLFISCHMDQVYMLNKIKISNNKEHLLRAMFQVWVRIDTPNYVIDNYYLTVGGIKESIIKNILADNDLLLQIEFLFTPPWDDLLIKGLKKDENVCGIEEAFEYIKEINNRRVVVGQYLKVHKMPICCCPSCGFPTIAERGNYDICSICNWEDDGQDDDDAWQIRGANGDLSLTDSRLLFKNTLKNLPELLCGSIVSDPEEMIRLIKIRDKNLSMVKKKFNYKVIFDNPLWENFKKIQKNTLSIFIKR